MPRTIMTSALAVALLLGLAGTALAGQPVKTTIWLDGAQVRTILPPAASPQDGTDPFYMVPGTGGVAAVGPGDAGYHGGHWQVYLVVWNVTQRPLTSDEAIAEAALAGDITITRASELDFLCPIQP
ncbi:MAG TPA: hypothetical protein VGQ89_00850 [Candidatus Limnocylindrales bacterium]|jgi:hypothetical protein|nr:hypothetical protein [Candidatus Limnocylindrales bacterium]